MFKIDDWVDRLTPLKNGELARIRTHRASGMIVRCETCSSDAHTTETCPTGATDWPDLMERSKNREILEEAWHERSLERQTIIERDLMPLYKAGPRRTGRCSEYHVASVAEAQQILRLLSGVTDICFAEYLDGSYQLTVFQN
jgi:hypothetical protein